MKKFVMASLLCSVFLITPLSLMPAGAVANSVNNDKGYISVSYTSEKEVAPDTVEISIAVKTEDKKSMQEATRKNKEISDKIYAYLKSSINTSNGDFIKTSNYSASPIYSYNSGKKNFERYEVSNNIIVHTKSLDNISVMIDKSLTLGATNVNSLNFSLSEKDAQCSDLLVATTKQARQRAASVATAAGTSITGIKSLNTSCSVNNNYAVPQYRNMLMSKAAGSMMDSVEASSSSPIEPGVIRIYSTVSADFYVK